MSASIPSDHLTHSHPPISLCLAQAAVALSDPPLKGPLEVASFVNGVTGLPAGRGVVSEPSGCHGDVKLWIRPPDRLRVLPSLGASFAIVTLGLIPIWLPAPDLLMDEEAVTMCFAHQVQTAGVNNSNEFLSVSCKVG